MNSDFARDEELNETRVACVYSHGEITFPSYVTEIMGWEPGTEVMVSKVDGMLIVQPFRSRCSFCGSMVDVKEVSDKFI